VLNCVLGTGPLSEGRTTWRVQIATSVSTVTCYGLNGTGFNLQHAQAFCCSIGIGPLFEGRTTWRVQIATSVSHSDLLWAEWYGVQFAARTGILLLNWVLGIGYWATFRGKNHLTSSDSYVSQSQWLVMGWMVLGSICSTHRHFAAQLGTGPLSEGRTTWRVQIATSVTVTCYGLNGTGFNLQHAQAFCCSIGIGPLSEGRTTHLYPASEEIFTMGECILLRV
jgi:low affinity Fe/Cu permease